MAVAGIAVTCDGRTERRDGASSLVIDVEVKGATIVEASLEWKRVRNRLTSAISFCFCSDVHCIMKLTSCRARMTYAFQSSRQNY